MEMCRDAITPDQHSTWLVTTELDQNLIFHIAPEQWLRLVIVFGGSMGLTQARNCTAGGEHFTRNIGVIMQRGVGVTIIL